MSKKVLTGYRLSPQQERLFAVQGEGKPLTLQMTILVSGTVCVPTLKLIIQNLINKHDSLRLVYRKMDGFKDIVQIIEPPSTIDWEEHVHNKICACTDGGMKIELELRSDKEVAISMSVPASNIDWWTLKLIMNELSDAYTQVINNEKINVECDLQYIDYSEWLHDIRGSEESDVWHEFWKNTDFSAIKQMKLPFESRERNEVFNPQKYSVSIQEKNVLQLSELADREGVTISELLFTAWQILLYRQIGLEQMPIGYQFNNRSFQEMEGLFGLFSQVIPIASPVQDNMTFSEAVREVDYLIKETLESTEYFDWKFVQEQNSDLKYLPYAYRYFDWPKSIKTNGINFELEYLEGINDKFHLLLTCLKKEEEIELQLEFDSFVLSREYVCQLASAFEILLQSILNNEDTSIHRLSMLGIEERKKRLASVQTVSNNLGIECVHQLFEKQVMSTPDAIAVCCEDQKMTYKELNERANQFAHYLYSLGIKSEERVGLYLNRSLDMIIGLLATLKVGGAYVPIDPGFPKERLEFLLQDTDASVLITQKALAKTLPELSVKVLEIDEKKDYVNLSGTENLNISVGGQNLAYIIYTSGSTGKPKGVQIEHRNLLNYFQGITEFLKFPEGTSYATVSTLAADLGNTSIYSALCTGGTLHVITQELLEDHLRLMQYNTKHKIDVLKIVPSHLSSLLYTENPVALLPTKCLIFGGEALSWELVNQVQSLVPELKIVNHYGPTETTVGVLAYEVKESLLREKGTEFVPLGQSLSGSTVFVLDEFMEPVPVGVEGEIWIGGMGVARGYINQPTLTERYFVPNPFTNVEGTYIYRTGDKALYQPDGHVYYVGRSDQQVKIRGYRVELGEVEMAIRKHPDIQESIVILDKQQEMKRLVAYIVPRIKMTSDVESNLKQYLESVLPNWMIPQIIVPLSQMPLTSNGKIDRQHLSNPDMFIQKQNIEYVEPRNLIELELVHLWREILNEENIGIYDSFLDLGGDSLLGLRMVAEIQKRFQHSLTLLQLYEYQTIEKIAESIRLDMDNLNKSRTLIPLKTEGSRPPFFCMHPGTGDVICYVHLVRALHPDQPFYGLQAPGFEDEQVPLSRIPKMASLYIKSIQEVQPKGPYYLGGWSFGGLVAYEVGRQLQELGEEVAFIGMFDTTAMLHTYKDTSHFDEKKLLPIFAKELVYKFGIEEPIYSKDTNMNDPMSVLAPIVYKALENGEMLNHHGATDITDVLRIFKVFRACREAVYYYNPQSHLQRVTLYRTTDNVEMFHGPNRHETLGWGEVVSSVSVVDTIGDHLTMIQRPEYAAELARKLCQDLQERFEALSAKK
ncbi:non-ribosomal peptide synthetase [Bacillus thuringiensis]|uniref:non-ribosomal peptide synthetase n=1 Tax=Bacillus thuringiensis TaxID=1428 RepID=UPI000BF67BDA|nr:non-ribosomal peptide synthetase [Bacillus thuringiensis]PEY73224.1 hypothetical protein CN355_11320 [Bacillus thuringiensis]